MRLSIREEVAYNRIVTELIETAMAEAVAEVEMERMLHEMVDYLALNLGEDLECNMEMPSPLRNEETGRTKDCGKNDEVCQMLDELERKLHIKKDSEPTFIDGRKNLDKETPKREDAHQEGNKEENIEKKTEDINGKETKETYTDEQSKSQKHRSISIFTKRRKTKPKVENEDKVSTSAEKKAKKEKSILKRFRNFLCCCCKTDK